MTFWDWLYRVGPGWPSERQWVTTGLFGSFWVNDIARKKLKAHGIRVVQMIPKGTGREATETVVDAPAEETGWQLGYLALAYSTNAALQELWRGTDWSGDGYLQSLRKLPGTRTWKVRFGSDRPDNALLVPLDVFRGDEG